MSEKKKILNMVADGKISAEEAEKLISAINSEPARETNKSKLVIRITNEAQGKTKLNIALPLNVIKLGLKFIPDKEKLHADFGTTNFDFSNINWREILEMAAAGETDDLFYMDYEEDDGTVSTIRIFVE